MTVVECHLGQVEVSDQPYWHMPGNGFFGDIFYHNATIAKGLVWSHSAVSFGVPFGDAVQSPYSAFNSNKEKERIFEEIRAREFPQCPPRLKGFFLFDDLSLTQRANQEWCGNSPRSVLECRVLQSSLIHRADARWLDSLQDKWPEMARKYWAGEMSDAPFPEIVVMGGIYFPTWQEFNLLVPIDAIDA